MASHEFDDWRQQVEGYVDQMEVAIENLRAVATPRVGVLGQEMRATFYRVEESAERAIGSLRGLQEQVTKFLEF
jgi:uncharacterized protein YukE